MNSGLSTQDFQVLELAGPATAACGRLLAEAGAEVIKVEPPGGTPERWWPPLVGPAGRGVSAFSLFHDTGKRSLTLDLSEPAGRELFLDLAATADVVLEGLPPGELARKGLSFEALRARNPGLVLVSVTPFGQDGPYRSYQADDLVAFALGGLMFISGVPGQPPVVAPDQQAYTLAGTHAALAALAALWGRARYSHGDWIDVSAFECLAAQENLISSYRGPGRFTRRNGSQHGTALPGRILACRDGYVHLFVGHDKPAWERFLDWIGHPPELADERLANINVRWEHFDLVMRLVEQFVGPRTRAELYESAQAHHVPCVPVYRPAEFPEDPQTRSRDLVVEVPHPDLGTYRTLRSPLSPVGADPGVRPSSLPPSPLRPAPRPGQHNEELAQALAFERGACAPRLSSFPPGRRPEGRASDLRPALQGGSPPPPVSASPAHPEPVEGLRVPTPGPLSGVRVAAFTHVAAGPYATLQLAYLGAEVIKVESATRPDYWRFRERNSDPEQSRCFADHNKNVRSVSLNLKTAEGLDLARRLIARSDAVIDNYSVGVMDRLGLGFEQARRERPDTIVLHMSGLGATGPRSHYVTFGPSIMALCGVTHLWNLPGQAAPVGSQSSYPDFLVGVYAAYALVAALHRRARTGEAQVLDLAQADAMACGIGPSCVAALNGAPVHPIGNASPTRAPHGCYPCQGGDDAWCVIAVETEQQWVGLKQALGQPSWAGEARFSTAAGRLEHAEALDRYVADWTRRFTPREVMETCQAHGVPAGLVATGEDLNLDPHLQARGFLVEREHPRLGLLRLPGSPVRFQHAQLPLWRLGPLLGQDNDYVLREVLGLSQEEVRLYSERGALI